MAQKPKVIAIVGPTASGKTSLSIKLAKQLNGEVISADSRQVYRDLDIGTGKVTLNEMDGVPHHLLDVADMHEIYTGTDFVRDAEITISDITERNKLPIIAGGTFFYLDLLTGKMKAAPVAPDADFRESLEQYSNEQLVELLQANDPRRAKDIDQHNRRRLVRALEIIHTLGTVPEVEVADSPYDCLTLGIQVEKEALRDKFKNRLAGWLEQGLLDEVSAIRQQLSSERFKELGFEYTLTAEYLDKLITKDELFEKFVQKNWQYAKQQMTWLKKDPEIVWVDPADTERILTTTQNFLSGE